MKFPVELLENVSPDYLEQSANEYMSELLYTKTETHLNLPESKKVDISLCNMGFVPLYGEDIKCKVLALFSPEDNSKAVGLYLMGQWWSAEDILKTADPSRTGLCMVRTLGERTVLYVLNRIIYRTKEKAQDETPFLCHGEDDVAKILWKDGEAIGFYSVKPEGSHCRRFHTQYYQLTVMDTIFIRKCHRGKGHGLQMLKDFADSFRRECVGLKYPLSPAMYEVCRKYLSRYPADSERLWEVQGIGNPYERTQVERKLQIMELKGNNQKQAMHNLNFDTEDTDESSDNGITDVMERTEYTDLVEEVIQWKKTKEVKDTAVTTCGRSSKIGEKTGEATEKILRVEEIESGVQSSLDEQVSYCEKHSLNVKGADLKDTYVTVMPMATMPEISDLYCIEQKEVTPEGSLQDVLGQSTTQGAMVTPEDALEKEEVVLPVPVMDIQSIENNQETQILKSLEDTIGPEELQPQEHQQVVEVEIVKMALEAEIVKEQHDETKEGENHKDKETYAEILETQKDKEQVDIAKSINTDQVLEPAQKENAHDVKEEKLSELVEEKRAHTKASTEKHGDKQKSNYGTPVRYSKRLRDEPPESDLTKIVLRSSTKSATFKQMSPQKTKAVKRQIWSPQQTKATKRPKKPVKASDDHKMEQKKVVVSNTEVSEKTESVSVTTEEQNENLIAHLKHCVDEARNVENEYLGEETDDNLMEAEIKLDASLEENRTKEQDRIIGGEKEEIVKMASDEQETAIMAEDDAETEIKEKSAEQFATEPVEKHMEESATEIVATLVGQNTEEAISTQKATVMLVDVCEAPPTNTGQNEYAQSEEYLDQETHKTTSTDENRQENKKEDLLQQMEPHTDSTEKEQKMEVTESVEIVECMDKTDNSSIDKTDRILAEIIKIEESAVSKDEDRPSESTVTDEILEMQEDKPVKECKTQEIPVENIKDITGSSKDIEEDISDILFEVAEEEDPNEASCENKLGLSRKLKDQPAESEITQRVTRSCIQTKTEKAMNKSEDKQQESDVTHKNQNENVIRTLSGSVEEVRSRENQYSEQETAHDHNLMEVEDKINSGSPDENKAEALVDVHDAGETEGKATQHSAIESVKEQKVESDDRQITKEATSAVKMQNAIVVLVDFNKVSHLPTDDSKTAKETPETTVQVDQEMSASADYDREKSKEGEGLMQTEMEVEPSEKEKVLEMRNEMIVGVVEQIGYSNEATEEIIDETMDNEDGDTSKNAVESTKQVHTKEPDKPEKSSKNEKDSKSLTEEDDNTMEFSESENEVMIGTTQHSKAMGHKENSKQAVRLSKDKNEIESRTLPITSTPQRKSVCPQNQEPPKETNLDDMPDKNMEEIDMSFEISTEQSILSNQEMNKHEDPELINSRQVMEVEGGENAQNSNEEMILHNTAQEHAENLATGSAANLVGKTTPQAEKEVETTYNKSSPGKCVDKHDLVKPQEEISDEEMPTLITKNLRNRTIIAESPLQRKPKHLITQAVTTQREEIELEAHPSEKVAVEITADLNTAIEEKSKFETNFSNENEDIYVVSEVGRYESVTADQQQEPIEVEDLVEDDVEHRVENTTECTLNQEQDIGVLVEDKELIAENLVEKELDNPDKAGAVKTGNKIGQEYSALEESEGESTKIINQKLFDEKNDENGNKPITEDTLDQEVDGVGVEQRVLRKRTTNMQDTSERKSKRFHKQDDNNMEEVNMPFDSSTQKSTQSSQEMNKHEDPELINSGQVIEVEGGENAQNSSEEMILPCTAQEHEEDLLTGSAANLVGKITLQLEKEVETTYNKSSPGIFVDKHDLVKRQEEISDEEMPTVITKNLRNRTIIAESPLHRKPKHLITQVVSTQREEIELKAQPSEKVAVETTADLNTAIEEKSKFETNFSNENEDIYVVCELGRYESVTAHQQQETIEVEDLVEDDAEHHVENTTECTLNQEQNTGILVDDKELIAENLVEKELDNPDKAGAVKTGNKIGQDGSALEESEGESSNTINNKQFDQKNDDNGSIPITEDILDQEEDGVGVEQRVLRKRATNSQATSTIKSKRFHKQDEEIPRETVMKYTEDPGSAMEQVIEVVSETTLQGENQETVDSERVLEVEDICGKTNQIIDTSDTEQSVSEQAKPNEFINVSEKDTDVKMLSQEEEKAKEELMEEEPENANNEDELKESQHETGQYEKMTVETAEGNVTGEDFSLRLDEEVPEHDSMKDSKPSPKDKPDVKTKQVSSRQTSTRRSKRLLQECLSEKGDKSVDEEVKEVVNSEDEKKPQHKRQATELIHRRSERLAKP